LMKLKKNLPISCLNGTKNKTMTGYEDAIFPGFATLSRNKIAFSSASSCIRLEKESFPR
jgi:hypothetical protein